uniref:Uncharacterized protein n=1 Tax=Zea mays TaxID=4577 RepID=B7ZZH2_MAIZE|nr:unknown [Zea mays]
MLSCQFRRTWSEAFLVTAHTGHAQTPASHPRHRHRCRHGRSSTHASAWPHDLHALARPPYASAPSPCSCSNSKQHDCASSASPSAAAPAASAPAHGDCICVRLSSVARRPAATPSWRLAMSCHAWPSAPVCRSVSSSATLRSMARSSSASAARRRRAAARSAASTTVRKCRRRASCSPARSLSFCTASPSETPPFAAQ